MSEELIERLRAAEEEAARLKKQLAEMQTVDSPGSSSSITEKTPRPQAVSRIDGGDFRRETLAFVGMLSNSVIIIVVVIIPMYVADYIDCMRLT